MRLNLVLSLVCCPLITATPTPLIYPDSYPKELTETLHGVTVSDPYRWLEKLDSKQTQTWINAQNDLARSYLEKIDGRDTIKKHLTKLWNVERFGIPFREGDRYFFTKNDGLQNQSILYTATSLETEPKVLLDPNKLSKDGTVALSSYAVSHNARYLAYAVSKSGSDWIEWKVRDITTGKDLSDHLKWSKFSGASWTKDNKGFYYGRFTAPEKGEKYTARNTGKQIYYHRLGTPQSEDQLIYERPDHPEWGLYSWLTDDGRYLMISAKKGTDTNNALFYKDLSVPDSKVKTLFSKFDASYRVVSNIGSTFLIQTDHHAPHKKLISVSLDQPDPENPKNWKTIIPESQQTLRGISHTGGILIANYMKDAQSVVQRFKIDGTPLADIKLPGIGTAYGFGGKPDQKETFYAYSSFTAPSTIYRYNPATNISTPFKVPSLTFDPSQYTTKQVFFTSKDGTKVPMFIVHKKGIALNGKNPTYLYAYGGFNISILPRYSPATIAWLDMGGIYVVANLRGGGEYGEEWHKAGMKLNKQNVFDDFISAAEFLIAKKYTSPKKLAIVGGSNGGLLVGACMTQRPDLFGACLPAVGVMDMLRFHKFTIGWAWQAEYGSPDNEKEFKALYAYSPYHNLKKGTSYPATLITTSDHDDRVVPSHSYKFAAALQAAHKGPQPVMIRIETKSGHGAGTPTSKRIQQAVDRYAFLSRELNFPIRLP